MGSFVQNLMFASFGFLSCGGITPVMALGMAGIVLLASAAQFFLLFKKRRSGWFPVLFVAAALLCSFLEYLAPPCTFCRESWPAGWRIWRS